MLQSLILLADRNSPANQWLRENPLVLAGIMGLIGAALVFFGILGLKTGTAKDKYGNEMTGGLAQFSSIVRLIGGVAAIGAAIYIAIFGAW
ncbi:MAG: hypothetical protein AAF483_20445 [Planctomycetota bacterium]